MGECATRPASAGQHLERAELARAGRALSGESLEEHHHAKEIAGTARSSRSVTLALNRSALPAQTGPYRHKCARRRRGTPRRAMVPQQGDRAMQSAARGMTTLVLGGRGLLGHRICQALSLRGQPVATASRSDADHPVDVTDAAALNHVLDHIQPGVIINCVAEIDLARCQSDPAHADAVNAKPVEVLAQWCKVSS